MGPIVRSTWHRKNGGRRQTFSEPFNRSAYVWHFTKHLAGAQEGQPGASRRPPSSHSGSSTQHRRRPSQAWPHARKAAGLEGAGGGLDERGSTTARAVFPWPHLTADPGCTRLPARPRRCEVTEAHVSAGRLGSRTRCTQSIPSSQWERDKAAPPARTHAGVAQASSAPERQGPRRVLSSRTVREDEAAALVDWGRGGDDMPREEL